MVELTIFEYVLLCIILFGFGYTIAIDHEIRKQSLKEEEQLKQLEEQKKIEERHVKFITLK